MRINHCHSLALCAILGAIVSACAAGAPPPPVQQPPQALSTPPVRQSDGTFTARWPVLEGFAIDTVKDRARKHPVRLNVAEDIREKCALPDVYFDFDTSVVSEEDEEQIANLAHCFTKGPLRDRRLLLIGRADLTGDPTYNMGLGLRRAANVKLHLLQNGVAATRIATTTRGATAVLGPFKGYTYADDRRVDIVLAP